MKKSKHYKGIAPSVSHGKGGLGAELQKQASDHADLVVGKDMYKGSIGPKVGEDAGQTGGIKEGY